MSNVDCSDPEIGKHYKSILSGEAGDGAWMLMGYSDKTTVVLKETGNTGIAGLLAQFEDEKIQYGFVSVDMNPGMKYVMITWVN